MNETISTILSRRSCRSFRPDPVPAEIIDQICRAGSHAASGRGMQSPIILAVTDKAVRDRLSAVNAKIMGSSGDPFYGAPVVLVVLSDRSRPTYVYDGSLVMGNLMLAAHALGVDSCWIHRAKETFETEEWKAFLREHGIAGDYEGIGNCVLGYAQGELHPYVPRKEDYIIHI